MHKFLKIFLTFSLYFSAAQATVEKLKTKVIAIYPHSTSDFTQGLICEKEIIYESCGLYQNSCLKKYDLTTGKLLNRANLSPNFFAEGIALHDNQLIQLTWKEHTAFVYNLTTFEIVEKISYEGEGWGLCQDGNSVWMSNGTSQIVKRNAKTFEIEQTLQVKLGSQSKGLVNDLICVDKNLYANIFGSDEILRIDKESGQVTAIIDASHLLTSIQKRQLKAGAVLNGIAYRKEKILSWLQASIGPIFLK